MKRTGLFIVFFIVFSAINGYGSGKKELSELTKKVAVIEVNLKNIQDNMALEDRIKKLEDGLLDKEGSPLSGTRGKTEADSEQQEPASPAARRDRPPAIPENILLERGQDYLTQDVVVDFMQKYSRSSWFSRRDINALVKAYFELAKEEQVNHEIAIAQMWYATRELSRDDLLKNCNYAGLDAVKRGTFNNRDSGVRAHIQHLKGYASTVRPKNIVDPRYEILVAKGYLGKGATLEKLSVWWSPNNKEYATKIVKILNDLYQYQYDSRQ